MTEEEWLTSRDIHTLVEFQYSQKRSRQLRLFGCGCCRYFGAWNRVERMKQALIRAERFADGELSESTMEKWSREAWAAFQEARTAKTISPEAEMYLAIRDVTMPSRYSGYTDAWRGFWIHATEFELDSKDEAISILLALLRDIFGNPFRPVTFDPAWRTDTSAALAKGMYESRDFSAMPILADALQDAGCGNEEVLNHCRDEKQVHVRGCWVVDLVLGKA